jgi:uncharacterized protein DUF4332
MTFKFSEFPGIDQNQVTKLRLVSIETTDDMMRVWGDEPKRTSLVEKTGISLEQFAKLASMARLARMKNVGTKYAAVLLAAGIDGPKSLFEYTQESLLKRLGDVIVEKKLTGTAPTREEIATWFEEMKPVVVAT